METWREQRSLHENEGKRSGHGTEVRCKAAAKGSTVQEEIKEKSNVNRQLIGLKPIWKENQLSRRQESFERQTMRNLL